MASMRVFILIITALMLICTFTPANADGVFLTKITPNIDPASHARDITEPVQKALIVHSDGIEHLYLQVSYKGNASEFAWLVPTPSRPEVSKVDAPVFHILHNATAPLVRYWFNADQKLKYFQAMATPIEQRLSKSLDVDVLEEKTVGVYDIAVLRAGNAEDLLKWLRTNGYQMSPKLISVLSDYISRGWVFTAMRINTGYHGKVDKRLSEGVLESLKFSFDTAQPIYPLKISSLNKGKTDVLLYVFAQHRVNESLLTTECSLDRYPSHFMFGDNELLRFDPNLPSARLTKLTAKLLPEQMTHDLVLKQAPSDDIMPVQVVSPPLLDNIGASSLLLLDNLMPYPYSLTVFGFMGLIALSPIGRKRWRVWIAVGIVFVVVGIISNGGIARQIASYCAKNGGYSLIGFVSLMLIAAIVICAAITIVRSRQVLKTMENEREA